jgi:hypothetical protein
MFGIFSHAVLDIRGHLTPTRNVLQFCKRGQRGTRQSYSKSLIMPGPVTGAGQKRKSAFDRPVQNSNARKRQKNQDARAIPTQRGDPALSANGELNITSFVKAREFEISALDKSMRKARQTLMSRAFQQVPRHMRRRTASHNAKKVPRRLRRRAVREVRTLSLWLDLLLLTMADQENR